MAMIVCFPVDRKFPCALDAASRHRIAGRRRRRSIAIAVPEIALSRRRSGIQVARTLFFSMPSTFRETAGMAVLRVLERSPRPSLGGLANFE